MNSMNDNQCFLTRLEQLKLLSASGTSPSLLADEYRSLYLHLKETNVNNLDKSGLKDEASFYLKKYTDLVDCMEESGLNNFAEGALALCSHHKNESSKWETSLSVENVLQWPIFQDCIESLRSQPIVHQMNFNKLVEEDVLDVDPSIPLKKETQTDMAVASTSQGNNRGCNSKYLTTNQKTSSNEIPLNRIPENLKAFNDTGPWNQVGYNQRTLPIISGESPMTLFQAMDTHKPLHVMEGERRQMFPSRVSGPGHFSFKPQHPEANHTVWSNQSARDVNSEPKSGFEVNPNKYGGPFANLGQKHKVQNNWNDNQRVGKSWQQGHSADDDAEEDSKPTPFKTAKQQFVINQQKKFGNTAERSQFSSCNYGAIKKSLGTRRGPASRFVPPVLNRDSDEGECPYPSRNQGGASGREEQEEPVDERLKGIDPKMIELINNEIMDHGADITWTDIAGLEFAKKTIKEIVVWPMLRPDIFTGLRGPPKGLLLFGPPGTGKTLIGKCIASQSKSTFFCISASSLTSKWVGEGEKMVRALFAVARCNQPAVVFIDEIDSLLSQRSDGEHESSRRIKTEFLVQLDGASTASEDKILVIGATNRPQEIDEAARRRFVKRLLIPLPESVARKHIILNLMSQQNSHLSDSDVDAISEQTDGYSGADMSNLCREAALGPIRSIPFEQMETITPEQVRPILVEDFKDAMRQVRASVSPKDLELYMEWNKMYGSFGH